MHVIMYHFQRCAKTHTVHLTMLINKLSNITVPACVDTQLMTLMLIPNPSNIMVRFYWGKCCCIMRHASVNIVHMSRNVCMVMKFEWINTCYCHHTSLCTCWSDIISNACNYVLFPEVCQKTHSTFEHVNTQVTQYDSTIMYKYMIDNMSVNSKSIKYNGTILLR
jgi:hypothetical protein